MNEAETRAELIDPKLKACGWGVVEGSKILRERNVCKITDGRIQVGGGRKKPLIADYILVYKGIKLAVVEAKSDALEVSEGVAQAKQYAAKLNLETTYATNGKEIYQICIKTGAEDLVADFLSPQELWDKTYSDQNDWRDKFANIPFEDKSGTWQLRYYQEIAIKNTLEAVAQNKDRILLTLATGTGKTAIAFQIAWKLFQTRWNLNRDGQRRPRILFLADRNILADQAFNAFSAFPEDAMVRIKPKEIKKKGKVPTNGSLFFTIFQSFMSESIDNGKSKINDIKTHTDYLMVAESQAKYGASNYNFGQYPKDYFDFIIIDECHRGGANDEGNWRGILAYFSPAVQLGLTATPKRKDNVNTYKYFGDPMTRKTLLEKLDEAGFGKEELNTLQKLIDAEKSDLYDVLEYVFNSDIKPITREERVSRAEATIFALLNDKQKEFIEFVLSKYIETGVEELSQEKLPILLTNKYQSLKDAKEILGDVANISSLFIAFQQHLYLQNAA